MRTASCPQASNEQGLVPFFNLHLLYVEHGAQDRQVNDPAKAERDLLTELKQCPAAA